MDIEPKLVSIILPTYNRAHLLPAAIDSVLAQTYKNWELIIWDDGSSDGTEKVIQAYSDKRIRFFRDENHGKSYALNQGLSLARGGLIAFLDDDDTWLPKKLSIQAVAMERYPQLDLFFGNYYNINVEDQSYDIGFNQTSDGLSRLVTNNLDGGVMIIQQKFLEGICRNNFMAFDTTMIQKRVFESIGYFNESLRNGEDLEFWWRFGMSDLKVAYTEEILLKRVKYPGSLSGRSVGSSLHRLESLNTCKELAIKQSHADLVSLLSPLYRNTWHNLIAAYGKEKDLVQAYSAFQHSVAYGFRPGALRLIAGAIYNTLKK